ncbi:Leucine-rich repeat-containing protein 71 [Paragonimus heterotremus]|uniref:Leucine-rich repeat-containing protein 71 n=1 Tax=Paragonimus heterotremus TaxID=100268 RepID=A0A8J4WIL4_9TREM|nr:Leucine-rich repeat-containing protein 71 [Paragonimus heterotremus]
MCIIHPVVFQTNSTSDDTTTKHNFNPTTFSLTRTLNYLKPKIQVIKENADKPETVTEVYLRGWKIGDTFLGILLDCFTAAPKLHTINFWRVGLNAEQVKQLADFLSTDGQIKQLTIDANESLNEETFAQLIQETGSLTKLNLRYCNLGPNEAKHIATRLGSTTSANSRLLSLDLSGNQLKDEGAIYLAQALRTNRTLLTLSLSNNKIGDAGCVALATVVSRFFLTHEEILQRRQLQSVRQRFDSPQRNTRTPTPVKRAKNHPLNKDASGKRRDRSNRGRATKEPEIKEKEEKAGTKSKKAEQTSPKKDSGKVTSSKGRGGRSSRSDKSALDPELIEGSSETGESTHPLLEKGEYVEPHGLQVTGNFVLAFLNLSRNNVTEHGLQQLVAAVEFQSQYLHSAPRANETGLLKVLLRGNLFDETCEQMQHFNETMSARDPLNKQATMSDGDLGSVDVLDNG